LAPGNADARLDVSIGGVPLLGSGMHIPEDFGLDARTDASGRCLHGWVRLGWLPTQIPKLRLEDEHGSSGGLLARAGVGPGGRCSFDLELDTVGIAGERLRIEAQLPDGRWRELPDSPLLLGASWHVPESPVGAGAWQRRLPAPAVDVIIPVYRGREETLACIESVLATLGPDANIIVVDDATEDAVLAAALDVWSSNGRIALLRNSRNIGFVASVNRAMERNPTHDALLLNSDTRVFADWLPRLRAAAYSSASVGTVTPLSNSGSIASYPSTDAVMADPGDGAALHALAARTHPGVCPEIPVGVGFCLYIRRDCLRDTGMLDAAVFGKGYGEETDFCLRARGRGWSHRLAADVFVYHVGGRSFGTRRAALLDRSQRLLNLRHPGFDRSIADFIDQDPLHGLRRRLDEGRLKQFAGQFVLVVTHALSGGIDRFVKEQCRDLRAAGRFPLILRAVTAGDLLRCQLSTEALNVPNLHYDIPADLSALCDVLGGLRFEAIEIQHFLHLDPRVIEAVRSLSTPYDVVVHDYGWLCPRITLMDGSGKYCGEPALAACEQCVRRHGSHLGEVLSVADLRTRSGIWLREARQVLAPSADTAARLQRHFPKLRVSVQAHAAPNSPAPPTSRRVPGKTVRVALLGAIGEHKGYRILLECARQARSQRLALEFIVIGYTQDDAPLLETGKVSITGRYGDGEVSHLLRREQPDVIWLPSVWPETWCYTLDHALDSGLPLAAFDLGAIGERLRALGRGTLMPLDTDIEAINQCLLRLPTTDDAGAGAGAGAGATITPTPSVENSMTNASDVNLVPQAPDDVLSASVQLLPLTRGLYLFSVTSAAPASAVPASGMQLPAMHIGTGPGVPADLVEFMCGHSTQGSWLFAPSDRLVVKVNATAASLILSSLRAPGGNSLSIRVERLSANGETASAAPAPSAASTAEVGTSSVAAIGVRGQPEGAATSVPVCVTTHIRTRGDIQFAAVPWAGRVGLGLWIEAFNVRPLELLSATDIEYKGLTGSGFETPWLSDAQSCGTQGMAVPLVGFALRLKPAVTVAYDCEYSGYFQSGLIVGPLRDGAPCRSTVASDPLEGIQVRLLKRAAPPPRPDRRP
jgi:GT2 family glycosyltransferase/glycosyltransferase involved in cell wall biosynthesis